MAKDLTTPSPSPWKPLAAPELPAPGWAAEGRKAKRKSILCLMESQLRVLSKLQWN